VEVEIAISQPATPVARVVTGPDRVAFDFPNFLPAKELLNLAVRRGDVKSIRVGLFSTNPPVTRVVVDLAAPSDFQMFPSGKSVIIKFAAPVPSAAAAAKPKLVSVSSTVGPRTIVQRPLVQSPQTVVLEPKVIVGYANGKLIIKAEKASLAEILNEVHRQTGASVSMPPGAQQEQVFGSFGPGAPRDVLASILNGSQFNFIILGAENDPSRLQSVTLTLRGGGVSQPAIYNPVVENPVAAAVPSEAPQPQPDGVEPQSNSAAGQQPEMPGPEQGVQPPDQDQQNPPQE